MVGSPPLMGSEAEDATNAPSSSDNNSPLSPPSWTHGTWYYWTGVSYTFSSDNLVIENSTTTISLKDFPDVEISQTSNESSSPRSFLITLSSSGVRLQHYYFEEDTANNRINNWNEEDPPSATINKTNASLRVLAKTISSTLTPPAWLYGTWTKGSLITYTFTANNIEYDFSDGSIASLKDRHGYTGIEDTTSSPKTYTLFHNIYGNRRNAVQFVETVGDANKITVKNETMPISDTVFNDNGTITFTDYTRN